ncbi:MAG: hypothetical protein ACHQFX_06770 [Chitinophagales bacterium]
MRILIGLLIPFVILVACRNGEKSAPQVDQRKNSNVDSNAGNNDTIRKTDRSYTWSKKEQNKFLKDCEDGGEHHLTAEKLKDFCACMLLHSQDYYPSYSDMEKKSDEADDTSIFAACSDFLDEDDD